MNVDDQLMKAVKAEAARRGITMTELVECALRLILTQQELQPDELPPLPAWDFGEVLVDVANREALYEVLDADKPRWN